MDEPSIPVPAEPAGVTNPYLAGQPPASVTFEMQPRHVTMHPVLDSELDSLDGAATGLPLTFFGLAFGGGVTSLAALTQPLDDTAHATFVAIVVLCAMLSFFFGISAFVRWRQRQNLITRIKQRSGMKSSSP